MESTDSLIQKGAEGFASTLLLLYTDAVSAGFDSERMRWKYAYVHGPMLPVPLGNDDLLALQQIIDNNEVWCNKAATRPTNIAKMVVVQKAKNTVGEFLFPEHVELLEKGIADGIDMFRAIMPNRSVLLD